MNKSLLCVVALLVAAGCNKEKPSDAPAASATAAVASASATPAATIEPVASAAPVATDTAAVAAAPVAPAVVAKIPTEEDFETAASTQITAANASEQLAAIEKEINAK